MPPSNDPLAVRSAIYGSGAACSCQPVPIDRATLLGLLATTMRAPTAIRNEPLQFIVVQEDELIQRLSERIKRRLCAYDLRQRLDGETLQLLNQPDFNIFCNTSTLVLIGAKTLGKYTLAACWSAEENLMVAAQSIGLGTCVIGLAARALNMPDVKREFNIPEEAFTVAPVIIGLPQGKKVPDSRQTPVLRDLEAMRQRIAARLNSPGPGFQSPPTL